MSWPGVMRKKDMMCSKDDEEDYNSIQDNIDIEFS